MRLCINPLSDRRYLKLDTCAQLMLDSRYLMDFNTLESCPDHFSQIFKNVLMYAKRLDWPNCFICMQRQIVECTLSLVLCYVFVATVKPI